MKLVNLIRIVAMALLVPATGVAVAAMVVAPPASEEAGLIGAVETLPAAVVDDGRQDAGDYSHVVRLTASGELLGTLASLDASGSENAMAGVPVRISQQGALVAEVVTDSSGRFVAAGIAPGIYSIVAQNDQTIAAFGVYAVSHEATTSAVDSIESLGVASVDAAEVARLRRMYLPSAPLTDEEATNEAVFAKAMRQSYKVSRQIDRIDMVQVARENSSKSPAISIRNQIVAAPAGHLGGQLSQIFGAAVDFRSVRCFLVRNGETVAEVPCDAYGKFAFDGVEVGQYSFVAAGTGGFASLGLEVVDGGSVGLADGSQLVGNLVVSQIAVALVAQEDAGPAPPADGGNDDTAGFVFEGGGAGGGFGGGGGGGGGGGLFSARGLLMLGGGIGVGVAIGAGDGNDPASPATLTGN